MMRNNAENMENRENRDEGRSQRIKDRESSTYEDTSLVSWLMLKRFIVIPFKVENTENRIAFEVQGDPADIARCISNYHANEHVGIQDYVRCLKSVRGMMFTLKNMS